MELFAGYAVALGLLAALVRWRGDLWPKLADRPFPRPWIEVGWALLAALAVILIGQLYSHGLRIPARGSWRPLAESVNQIVIFAPMLALIPLRRHSWETAWVRRDHVLVRLAIGIGLATLAIIAYTLVRGATPDPWTVLTRVYRPTNAHIAVQVLLEDIAIAILVVRLAAAIGARKSVLAAAVLFSAGHIPALLTVGLTSKEVLGLLRDAVLAAGVLSIALRAADVWILWPVHFAMDMMQFAIPGRQP